jgi:2-polyprenyl-6-hydroxyphenyl methylase/3-demethylubiquinone-9 3-methyltransferase
VRSRWPAPTGSDPATPTTPTRRPPRRPRNDPAQYDDLAGEWWRPHGRYAGLHWLASARARLIPTAPPHGGLLLDVACGAGLLAPHLVGRLSRWQHVGVDVSAVGLRLARAHGVTPVRADALRLPFADGSLDCVVAGEVLEHLSDLGGAVAELSRVLKPGGTLVIDTIADSWVGRFAVVHVVERLPGGPPPGTHDPGLLVDPIRLRNLLHLNGLRVHRLRGLRPSGLDYVRWLARRRDAVRMLPTGSRLGIYQILAVKPPAP